MSLEYKVSFFTLLFALLFFFPHTVHGHFHRSNAHRNQQVHRQLDIPGIINSLDSILPDVGQSSDPGGTSSSQPPPTNSASDGSATTASTATTTSSSDTNSLSLPPQTSSSPPASDSAPTSPPTSDSAPTSAPTSDSAPTSSPSSSSSPSLTCPLGLDLLGNCILPPTSTSSTDVTSTSQTPTSSVDNPPVSLLPSSVLPSLPPVLPTSSPPQSSNAPSSPPTPSSSSDPNPMLLPSSLPISLPLLPTSSPPQSSNTPTSSPPPSSDITNSLPPLSASSPPVSSSGLPTPSILPQTTSQPTLTSGNQPSSPPPAPSSSTPIDPCGPLGVFLGHCSGTPIPSLGSTPSQSLTSNPSLPTSQAPSLSSGFDSSSQPPLFPTPSFSNPGASSSSGALPLPSNPSSSLSGTFSIPGSQPASDSATGSITTFSETNSGALTASSSPPVISFPSDTTSSGDQTSVQPTVSAGSSTPVVTPPNPQFSYVTISSLLGTSLPSSTIPPTLTNPDAASTTFSFSSNSVIPTTPPLPANLPARIYPSEQLDLNSLPSGSVLCSILLKPFLGWAFVAQNTQSQGQLFSWFPLIVSKALNIPLSETPAFALQAYAPSNYGGPSDVDLLLTQFLFFLPGDQVLLLANQIKVDSSPFHQVDQPYKELADQVDPAFSLTSVANPNAVPGSASAASSQGNKSRKDTIIGVVSALGGLALVVLGVLIFNGVKRSRQLRHLRLSDPNLPNDLYPDRTGRDFDQDSVGGARRRSFYFAEDSLRGQPHTAEQSIVPPMAQAQTQYVLQPGSEIQYDPRASPENIRERRAPVVPGAISAPILTQSSLNW